MAKSDEQIVKEAVSWAIEHGYNPMPQSLTHTDAEKFLSDTVFNVTERSYQQKGENK